MAVHQLQRADHPRKPTPHHSPQAENDPRRPEQNRPPPQALGRLSYLGNLIHATQPDHRLGRNAVQVEEVEESAVGRQQNRSGLFLKTRINQFKVEVLHFQLLEDDFAETESLDSLILSYNFISNLNNSLTPLKKLTFLNLTHNLLPEFSLEEIHSLKDLLVLDVSYNRITTVQGPTPVGDLITDMGFFGT